MTIGTKCRLGGGGADVRASTLLCHKHRPLMEGVKILCGHQREHALNKSGVAKLAQGAGQRVRHTDRTTQPEFRLNKQIRQGVFGSGWHGFGPSQDTCAMGHRCQPKLAVGKTLEFDVGGMFVDLIGVYACARPHGKRGRMFVCNTRQIIEQGACECSESFKMR